MNEQDWLNDFLDRYQAGEPAAPPTPEAELAADLSELAAAIQPDPAFVTRLGSQLAGDHTSTSQPFSSDGVISPRHVNQEHTRPMLNATVMTPPMRMPTPRRTLSLAAAVLLIVLGGLALTMYPRLSETTLPLAAQTTATPEPTLPLAVGGYTSDLSEPVLRQMREAGLTWLYGYIAYRDPVRSSAAMDQAQILITTAHREGFKILLMVNGSPDDMERVGDGFNPVFAQFLGDVAALGPDAIQVWNEQNLDQYWPKARLNGRDYVDLLKLAHAEIKRRDPAVKVIAGALAPTSAQSAFPGQLVNDDVYYQQMADAGAAQYADCIGVQYVEGTTPPDQTSGDKRNFPTSYLTTMLQRAAKPFRAANLPLCFTSLGYFSAEGLGAPTPDFFAWAKATTTDQQAQWTADAIQLLAGMSSVRVEMVILWRVNSRPLDVINAGFSIIRPDGRCPTCAVLARLRR
jgi:hypothetical protein